MTFTHSLRASLRKPWHRAAAALGLLLVLLAVWAPIAADAEGLAAGGVVDEASETIVVVSDLRAGAAKAGARVPPSTETHLNTEVPRQPTEAELALFFAAKAPRTAPPTTAAPVTTAPVPPPAPAPAPAVPAVSNGVWDQLAQCESSGNWGINTGSFDGGLQFLPSTWNSQGGQEFAPFAYQATREQQIAVAERLLAATGGSYRASWPGCSRKLGLA